MKAGQLHEQRRVVGAPAIGHLHELGQFVPGDVGLGIDVGLGAMAVVLVKGLGEGIELEAEEDIGGEGFLEGSEDLKAIGEAGDAFDFAHQLAEAAIVLQAHVDGNVEMAVAVEQGAHFESGAQADLVVAEGEGDAEQRPGGFELALDDVSEVGRSGRDGGGDELELAASAAAGLVKINSSFAASAFWSKTMILSVRPRATGDRRMRCSAISRP